MGDSNVWYRENDHVSLYEHTLYINFQVFNLDTVLCLYLRNHRGASPLSLVLISRDGTMMVF